MGILRWLERSVVRAMCGVQLKIAEELRTLCCLNETIDHLAVEKQCSLVLSCVEDKGWSCLVKGI